MALALRLKRLPAIVYQETLFQHSCLSSALIRQYVTSTDSTTKKPPKSTIPLPNGIENKTKNVERFQLNEKTLSSSETKLQKNQEPVTKAKISTQQVRENVRDYMFTRFFDYVKNYDKVLEVKFPSVVKGYRVFFDGVKTFFLDMKRFLKVYRIINSSTNGLGSLNRQELELYMKMPKDMIKIAPTLVFSSLPVVGYAVFPLVLMYPRTFLTSHFWTLQQKAEFNQFYFHERLTYNRPVFRELQAQLKSTIYHPKYEMFRSVLGQLGSGTHPTVEQILDIKDIFAAPPLTLIALPGKHIKLLNKLHGIHSLCFKRHSLYERAFLVHYMDKAICREGGVHNMSFEFLCNACYIRGLNPINLSTEEMIQWLRDWIKISNTITADHMTLFLHLPIFLGYNHPNNWQLIYCKDNKQIKGTKL